MAITVIMQDSRPDGAGGTYKKGSTYSLPDPLATYFLDIGLAKRTSARSEQTGATVTGDSAGRFPSAPSQDKSVPLTATPSDGKFVISAGGQDVTDQIGGGGASDGTAGTGMTYTVRNLDNATVTRIMLPSAPAELMLNWYDSTGSSGNLRYVLEAASLADATARLADDTAHGELAANGNPVIVKFEPTMFPVYIYVRASSAVGAGSNILSLLAKVSS